VGSYSGPADDGLSGWHPAYLRLGSTLDRCARRYAQFCRRYRLEPKPQRRSRWGGWQLWREIEPRAEGQAGLFGAAGASYRGGGTGTKRPQPVAILRPEVLHAVERFIRVNQPPGEASNWLR
jgi:putative transposase